MEGILVPSFLVISIFSQVPLRVRGHLAISGLFFYSSQTPRSSNPQARSQHTLHCPHSLID